MLRGRTGEEGDGRWRTEQGEVQTTSMNETSPRSALCAFIIQAHRLGNSAVLLCVVQVESLRKDIEILSQNHERDVDRKDAIIQMLDRDLEEVSNTPQKYHPTKEAAEQVQIRAEATCG